MAPTPPDRQAGQSVVAAAGGLAVFLAFLLFAVHLAVSLYATTTVTSHAYDAARRVAAAGDPGPDPAAVHRARERAEADVRASLGAYARRLAPFDWSGSTADVVQLRVRAENPSFLLGAVRGSRFDHIDRTVRVRVERVRDGSP